MGKRAIKKKKKPTWIQRKIAAFAGGSKRNRSTGSPTGSSEGGYLRKRSVAGRRTASKKRLVTTSGSRRRRREFPDKGPVTRKKSKLIKQRSAGPRMAARSSKKLYWERIALVTSSCVLVLLVGGSFWNYFAAHPFLREKSVIAQKKQKPLMRQSLLFIGVKESKSGERAAGIAVVLPGKDEEALAGWSIPQNTYVVIPGYGYEKIGMALESGTSTMVATVQNFLGIKIDHFVRLGLDDYKETVAKLHLEAALERAQQTDLNRDEYADFSRTFVRVPSQDVNLIPLPVKPLMVGKETFLQPDHEEIDRLFSLIWGISEKQRKGNPRVIILNGSGVPGVGGEAAERLIGINCRVIETENADNFDYDKTQIIIYKVAEKWANKIRDELGTGVILSKEMPQDLADVTVVIGKDYQPKNQLPKQ